MVNHDKHHDPTWPYEEVEGHETIASEPRWDCAAGFCVCPEAHEIDLQPKKFSVLLCDQRSEPMEGARCRVLANGILLNDEEEDWHADPEGWITVESHRLPEQVVVEWAPSGTPLEPHLPYRKLFYVDPARADRIEAARRRLHNLGFSDEATLEDNIREFQRAYGETPTGELAHVEEMLVDYHDRGLVPPIVQTGASAQGTQIVEEGKRRRQRRAQGAGARNKPGTASAANAKHDVRVIVTEVDDEGNAVQLMKSPTVELDEITDGEKPRKREAAPGHAQRGGEEYVFLVPGVPNGSWSVDASRQIMRTRTLGVIVAEGLMPLSLGENDAAVKEVRVQMKPSPPAPSVTLTLAQPPLVPQRHEKICWAAATASYNRAHKQIEHDPTWYVDKYREKKALDSEDMIDGGRGWLKYEQGEGMTHINVISPVADVSSAPTNAQIFTAELLIRKMEDHGHLLLVYPSGPKTSHVIVIYSVTWVFDDGARSIFHAMDPSGNASYRNYTFGAGWNLFGVRGNGTLFFSRARKK